MRVTWWPRVAIRTSAEQHPLLRLPDPLTAGNTLLPNRMCTLKAQAPSVVQLQHVPRQRNQGGVRPILLLLLLPRHHLHG